MLSTKLVQNSSLIFIVSFFITSLTFNLQAQNIVNEKTASKKAVKTFKKGIKLSYNGDFRNAEKAFLKVIKLEPNFAAAKLELSSIFYADGRTDEAVQQLKEITTFKGDDKIISKAYYGLGHSFFKAKKYDSAAEYFKTFLTLNNIHEERRKAAKSYLDKSIFISESLKNPVPFSPKILPQTINSIQDAEYLPSLTADETELVFTRRVNGRQEDFFSSKKIDGKWQPATPLNNVNTPDNEGAQAISADGNFLVFTACNRKGSLGSCDLFYSRKNKSGWSTPRNMGENINSKAWESQPSISANGNLLFFASKREGGYGGADIYASALSQNGSWSKPINLGPVINSEGDDQSPFFHADGKHLYFMSNGHPGMGKFDIFVATLDSNNTWLKPKNLGFPINTERNEGALIVSLDGQTAYFASDGLSLDSIQTIGTGGQKSRPTDLFYFTLPVHAKANKVTYVKANVYDATTKKPLQALVKLLDNNQQNKPFAQKWTTKEDGSFLMVLPEGNEYACSVNLKGYAFYSDRFEVALSNNNTALTPFQLDIPLQPLVAEETTVKEEETSPIVLKNVLFETASAELKKLSQYELNQLYKLMLDNPTIQIRIQGHTDNIGDTQSNQILSQNRAEAVANYLKQKGISSTRLSAIGFGETKPIASNKTSKERALNRRTEFVIIRQ